MSISAQFFTTENIGSLPVTFTKFEGNKSAFGAVICNS